MGGKLYTCNLIAKLQKLNSKIYLRNNGDELHGVQPAGIWIKKPRKGRKNLERGHSRRGRESAAGHIDQRLTWTPCPEVPEYEVLTDCGEYLVRGWRAIVLQCVKLKAFTIEAARKEFSASLGEQTWDNQGHDWKLNKLQEDMKNPKIEFTRF